MSNKDKIMEVATELFHLYGYDGTSVDMLVRKAEVSKSNFYYYFDSKEELGLSVLTELADNQLREFSKIMQADLNSFERLMRFYDEIVASHRKFFEQSVYPGCFFGNMALEQSSINEKFRSALDNYFSRCEAMVEECLREGIEQGFFRETLDPKRFARLMVSQFEGAILMVKTKKSISHIEDLVLYGKHLLLKDEWVHLIDERFNLKDKT